MSTQGGSTSDLPIWIQAIGTIIMAIIAFVAIFQDRIRKWLTKPVLDISLETSPPDCVKSPLKYVKNGKQFDSEGYYIRVKVFNSGNEQANNVEVFMSELQRKQADGSYKAYETFLPMNLTWTHLKNIYFPSISPKMYKHCDICQILKPSERKNIQYEDPSWPEFDKKKVVISFATMVKPFVLSHLAPYGEYKIKVIIAAANSQPVEKYLELNISGNWFDEEKKMLSEGIGVRVSK